MNHNAGTGYFGIRPEIAERVQLDHDFNEIIIGPTGFRYTGAEKALVTPHLTDGALLENVQIALNMAQARVSTVSNPPTTAGDELNLLMVEVFMRYQRVLRERKKDV